jgi:hypothetical protein
MIQILQIVKLIWIVHFNLFHSCNCSSTDPF